MSKCKTVTLRKRKIKNGTQYSLLENIKSLDPLL